MHEVYRIDVIPAHKPWRGYGHYLVKDKEVFDLFSDEMWLPEADISELPNELKYLAVEADWDDEKGECVPYKPTGRENWEEGTTTDDAGELVELEMNMSNILDNANLDDVSYPYILLDSVTVFCE